MDSSILRQESSFSTNLSNDDDSNNQKAFNSKRFFLGVWTDTVSLLMESLCLDCPATAMMFGRMDGHWSDRLDFLTVGLADGRVLVSLLPLPTRVVLTSTLSMPLSCAMSVAKSSKLRNIKAFFNESSPSSSTNANNSTGLLSPLPPPASSSGAAAVPKALIESHDLKDATGNNSPVLIIADEAATVKFLDVMVMTQLQLHSREVTSLSVSPSGYWIFSSSADGSLFMTATSSRAKDFTEVPEVAALENGLLVTERSQLQFLRTRMEEVDTVIDESRREHERSIHKLTEQKNQAISDLDIQMKREVKKRDEIILRGRDELQRQTKRLTEEMQSIQKKLTEDIVELEYSYERKLSQEALYLEKMRQAFDEVVVHSRMDMNDAQQQVSMFDSRLLEQRNVILGEAEKQKALVLAYVDYVKSRYGEVINSLEESQGDER